MTAKAAARKKLKGLATTKVRVRALAEFGDERKEQGIDQNIAVP